MRGLICCLMWLKNLIMIVVFGLVFMFIGLLFVMFIELFWIDSES